MTIKRYEMANALESGLDVRLGTNSIRLPAGTDEILVQEYDSKKLFGVYCRSKGSGFGVEYLSSSDKEIFLDYLKRNGLVKD